MSLFSLFGLVFIRTANVCHYFSRFLRLSLPIPHPPSNPLSSRSSHRSPARGQAAVPGTTLTPRSSVAPSIKWAHSGLPDFPERTQQRGRARRRRRRLAPGPRWRGHSSLQVAARPGNRAGSFIARTASQGWAGPLAPLGEASLGRGGAGAGLGRRPVGTGAPRRACGGARGGLGASGVCVSCVSHAGRQYACGPSPPHLPRGPPSRAGSAPRSPQPSWAR